MFLSKKLVAALLLAASRYIDVRGAYAAFADRPVTGAFAQSDLSND